MGKIIKANGPDYIAQEISFKVQYYNILRETANSFELRNTLLR